MSRLNRAGIVLVALLLVGSAAGAVVTTVNFGADAAQNPSIDTQVTKEAHQVGWEATAYEGNNGNLQYLNASLNTSQPNPFSLKATDINVSDYGAFPRKSETDNAASALDASEWSTDASGTAGSLSVSDVTTAPNVDAVEFSASSQTSGDVAKFTYSNFSVTSDAEKRYLQIAQDVTAVSSGASATLRVVDSDGDYAEVDLINQSKFESATTVVSNATGEGDVLQVQLGSLSVQGSGDGTLQELQSIEVRIADADATIRMAALNAEKLGEWQFGTRMVDSDGDGTKDESETVIEPHGTYSIESVGSMGSTFDTAVIHDLTMPMHFEAKQLEGESNIMFNFTKASNYPSFEWKVDQYYRLSLPDAYDLSYANAALEDDVSMPSSRYQEVEIAEGVGSTDFENISSWTSKLTQYDTQGAHRTLDATIQPGQSVVYHAQLIITDGERNNIESTSTSGAAGQRQKPDGGLLDSLFSLPGVIIGGLLGFLGLRARAGG